MISSSTQVAWITGGGSGIGRSLALGLAAAGWKVAVSGRTLASLKAVAAEAASGQIVPFVVDVTDAEAVARVAGEVEETLGPISLAILNAGDYKPMSLPEFDANLFKSLMDVNFLGVVYALSALLPRMSKRRDGQIILVGSLSAYRGLPKAAPYGATKAALLSLAESLRNEAADRGVRLRVASPGFVRTGLTAKNDFHMPSLIEPEQAAQAILRRLDSGAFEIAFPTGFAMFMKFIRLLPYALYFPLLRRLGK